MTTYRNVKRVWMQGREMTKAQLRIAFLCFNHLPNNSGVGLIRYLWISESRKLVNNYISIKKVDGNHYLVGSIGCEKSFANKREMLDYLWDVLIKEEWYKIPENVRKAFLN